MDNVIFEQIRTLAGATSYLHGHVIINISAIETQFNTYRQFLEDEIYRTNTSRLKTKTEGPFYNAELPHPGVPFAQEVKTLMDKYNHTYGSAVDHIADRL